MTQAIDKNGLEALVRPLEWTQKAPAAHQHEAFVYWAPGLGGHYRAERDGLLWMAHDEFVWQQYPSQKEAKAAAQADYVSRILSAFDLSASPQPQAHEAEPSPAAQPVAWPEWATDKHIAEGVLNEAETILALCIHDREHEIPGHVGAIKSYAGTLLGREERRHKYTVASPPRTEEGGSRDQGLEEALVAVLAECWVPSEGAESHVLNDLLILGRLESFESNPSVTYGNVMGERTGALPSARAREIVLGQVAARIAAALKGRAK